MLSGSVVRLFAVTLRILRLSKKPIESGRDSREFEDTSSSSSFLSFEIASGINCKKGLKILQDSKKKKKTRNIANSSVQDLELNCSYSWSINEIFRS